MPSGKLFFRLPQDSGWTDMYDTYGISLSDGAISRLMTPPPMKEAIENKSRLQHGKRVVRDDAYVKTDERTVSLEIHLTAPNKALFWSRYASFCSDFLSKGFFDIYHADIGSGTIFRMTYIDCEEFSEFQQQIGKFMLVLNEPDPDNRGGSDKWENEI